MRAYLFLLLPLAVVLAGCGGAHRSTTGTKPPPNKRTACAVGVYFATHATRAEERRAEAKLRQDPRVWRDVFISKAQALKAMERKLGKIPKTFTHPNPLPDALLVTPARLSETRQIEASLARSHWPGVANVNLKLCKKSEL
ncbi:MAG TPA: permease-like cell division protein FtsX [Gaiellaceae bacterium]